jgi:hypothetical protein
MFRSELYGPVLTAQGRCVDEEKRGERGATPRPNWEFSDQIRRDQSPRQFGGSAPDRRVRAFHTHPAEIFFLPCFPGFIARLDASEA